MYPRVFLYRSFAKFAQKNGLSDDALCDAVHALLSGSVDADLGGGVYKQRIARKGEGKSGGFRTLILYQLDRTCVFAYGFAKKDRQNITRREIEELKLLARTLRGYGDEEYDEAVREKVLKELSCQEGVSK